MHGPTSLKIVVVVLLLLGVLIPLVYFIKYKIRRGPKLEGYAFANFGYSSGTEGESPCEVGLF